MISHLLHQKNIKKLGANGNNHYLCDEIINLNDNDNVNFNLN